MLLLVHIRSAALTSLAKKKKKVYIFRIKYLSMAFVFINGHAVAVFSNKAIWS